LVWPIGVGQLLIAPIAKRRKIILTTAWSVIGAAEWLAYFYHYVKPAHHPELGFSWNHWVMSIGGALTGRATPARFCGLLILASMVAAIVLTVKHRAWSEHSFWLATVFFSLAVLGSITIGRSGYGAAQALSSRYATYSIPLWIAVYAMLASFHRNRIHRFAAPWAAVLFMAMLIGSGVSFVDGWETGRIHRNLQKYQQFVICTIDAQPDALIQTAAPNRIDVVRRYVPVLKKLQFNVFSDPALYERFQMPDPSLPVLETPTRFGLENIGPVSDGKVLLIQGWAVDWPAREPAGGVAVLLDGIAYPAYYGLQSDNAVQTLGSRKYLFSGFRCAIASKNVRPGKHTLSFRILDRDRKAVFAPSEPYVFQTE